MACPSGSIIICNDGDQLALGCENVLFMSHACSGKARFYSEKFLLYLSEHQEADCLKTIDAQSLTKPQLLLLLVAVKAYGPKVFRWWACIIGCDFSTLPRVGPVAFLEEVQRVKYDSLDALVTYFFGTVGTHKNSSAIEKARLKTTILDAEKLFVNPPVVNRKDNVVCELNSRKTITLLTTGLGSTLDVSAA